MQSLVELARGRRVVALTGAGCSTESGIPDYRGPTAKPRAPMQHREFVDHAHMRRRYWARSLLGWPRLAGASPNLGHRALATLEHAIEFQNVSFAYDDEPVLRDINFTARKGAVVALVGASGAGKSTVASLLLRFADPIAGRVTVGNVDLAECRTDVWRRLLAWVPQRPTIFRGTVADNIRFGAPRATRARTREAAMLAGADRFVRALPSGYETLVGDGGRPLSAGERRRIALARAFLRGAPFVILDEPTADLDPVSADVVAEAVERLRHGRTALLIAHRAELVRQADRVVSLDPDGTLFVPTNEAA